MLTIASSGTSSAGQKNINEDNFYMNGIFIAEGNAHSGGVYSDAKRRNVQFYAVFDGIGEEVESAASPNISFHEGQSSSFIAAHMMSKLQEHIINLRKKDKPYNLNDAVYKYMHKTNQQLFMNMQKNSVRSGASFALLCMDGIKICAYNVGNCKIFILRDGRLNLLTTNDTKVEELIYANQISPDIAKYTPENKVLTQYLGLYPQEKQTELHINNKLTLRPGDKFLLCSDGLCDSVSDSRMLEIMQQDISEQETIRELVKEAEQNGARENITAVVVGTNVSDNAAKVNKIRARSSDTPFYFKPLPLSFRKKFNLTPKTIKLIAFYIGIAAVAVCALVIAINGFQEWLFPEPANTVNPTGRGETVPGITVRVTTTEPETETTTRFNITTDESDLLPTDDATAPTFEEPTNPAPVVTTAPPTAEPTAPPAPTTSEPTEEPAVTDPATTEPPETSPPATDPPETEPQFTYPPVTDPPFTHPPVTEPPETEPPFTHPPVTEPPEETQPPEITEEPTVPLETEPPATEPPNDADNEEE